MARKLFSNTPEATEAEGTSNEANQTNETQESSMSTATENVVPSNEADEADEILADQEVGVEADPTTEAAPEAKPELDMSVFEAAVQAAVDGRDPSTGTVPDSLAAPVTQAYRDLPVSGKSKAKTHLIEVMRSGVEGGDLSTAMASMQLQKVLTPAKSSGSSTPKEPKAPADPNEAVAVQLAVLRTAFGWVKENLPEGAEAEAVKAKTDELVEAANGQLADYIAWLNRDEPAEGEEDQAEPEVSVVTKRAAKLAMSKVKVSTASGRASSGPGYSGPRRNVATHISQVFADKASGDFISITDLANATSAEYGDDHPSPGALAARLFPKDGDCSLTDVRPATVDGKRGAVKI